MVPVRTLGGRDMAMWCAVEAFLGLQRLLDASVRVSGAGNHGYERECSRAGVRSCLHLERWNYCYGNPAGASDAPAIGTWKLAMVVIRR